MEDKKISIIIPVFNSERYIEECIRSVLAQTHSSLEIIVVDDGSKDGSWDICKRLSEEDERVRVFKQKNGGAGSARRTGIKKATGDFFVFIDSDDTVSKHYIERLYVALANNNADISVCRSGSYGEVVSQTNTAHKVYHGKKGLEEYLYGRFGGGQITKMFRRELFEGLEIPDGNSAEDIELLYDVFSRAQVVEEDSYVGYLIRGRADSITNSSSYDKDRVGSLRVADEILKKSKKSGDGGLVDAARYLRFNMAFFVILRTDSKVGYNKCRKLLDAEKRSVLLNKFVSSRDRCYALFMCVVGVSLCVKYFRWRRRVA